MRNIFVTVAIVFFMSACQEDNNDLDIVKKYQPDNNYYKANLITLHYMIETDRPAELDSIYPKISDKLNMPTTAKNCKDGIYTGTSPSDAFGYYHKVTIEIENEKIISVKYDEVKSNGKSKKNNKIYAQQMEKTGTTPAEAYESMEKALTSTQNSMSIEAVSGATYSLYRFRYAVAIALMKAQL